MSDTERPADLLDDVPTGRDTVHVVLHSGGLDSSTAAARAVEIAPKIDALAYLDTGTGLAANEEYTRELARHLGVMPMTLGTPVDFAERVREHGFPGPSRHSIMYRSLKERQIGKLATMTGDRRLVLWTGVRSSESARRMAHVERVQEAERWTWVAPIHDWSRQDCHDYLDAEELPRNSLWNTLGRSGDCYCGCFGTREELLDLEAVGEEGHADWLRSLEEETDADDATALWAWASLSGHEQRAAAAERDDAQTFLCSSCGLRADGGECETVADTDRSADTEGSR